MKRERYRLDGNPKRAVDALGLQIAQFGFRGVHWDFDVPMFQMMPQGDRASIAVCTIEYHDDDVWAEAHAVLRLSRGF